MRVEKEKERVEKECEWRKSEKRESRDGVRVEKERVEKGCTWRERESE